jgi:membrane-associated phospholipid phosphatase
MSEHVFRTPALAAARPMPRQPRSRPPASPLTALGVAALCLIALFAIWWVAEFVPAAHFKDATTLYKFTLLSRPSVDHVARGLLRLLEPDLFVLWGIALVATAFARSKPRVALAVIAVLGLSPLTAELLKPLLAHQHDHVGYVSVAPASWPSGHATAATALALSAVLVAPSRLRAPVAALGVVFVAAVSFALLLLAWHMPSDVLGGYVVAALWMSLAVAAQRAADRRWPRRKPSDGELAATS